ncbi:MAG: MaoC family dehydratase [Candidatus Pacearchaeota archaeon]
MIKAGDIYTHEFSFTKEDVFKFAEVSGDKNPIHLDDEYASKTIFKRRIVHGFLGASIFSKVFGMLFPGEGTIYLSQTLKFMAPMYEDEAYTAQFTVLEVIPEKHRAKIETLILDKDGKTITSGEAVVMNSTKI